MLRRAIAAALFASLGFTTCASAEEPEHFSADLRSITASLRSSMSYARTGNIALAQVEIDDARAAWKRLLGQVPPPDQTGSLLVFLATGADRLARADQALAAGDGARAGSEILALRQSVRDLRQQSGLFDLNDCVFELATTMAALRDTAAGFGEARTPAEAVRDSGVRLRDHLRRCDGLAAADISGQAEFRRLIDGATSSANEIGRAATAGDAGLVHRYLIELQSFVNLLDFRFG